MTPTRDEAERSTPTSAEQAAPLAPSADGSPAERKVPGVPSHLQTAVAELLDQGPQGRPDTRAGHGAP